MPTSCICIGKGELEASTPLGWVARADMQVAKRLQQARLAVAAAWVRALPSLLRIKALFIRDEGVWF